MTWTQESSGVITLSSAQSWLGNIVSRKLTNSAIAGTNFNTVGYQSVGAVWGIPVGSSDVQYEALLNE